jgi:hypothetical protein
MKRSGALVNGQFLLCTVVMVFAFVLVPPVPAHTQCPTCSYYIDNSTDPSTYRRLSGQTGKVLISDLTGIYFFIPGCKSCHLAEVYIESVQKDYPFLEIKKKNMTVSEIQEERVLYDSFFKLPDQKQGIVPALFIGDNALVGEKEIVRSLSTILEGTNVLTAQHEEIMVNSRIANTFIERFSSLDVLGVLFAGLIDGVNPCAFMTLIFFISYSSSAQKKNHELIIFGTSFIAVVFLTYLVLGLGIFKFLYVIKNTSFIYPLLHVLITVFVLVLAGFSIADTVKAKKGNYSDFSLQLPRSVKLRIHKVIRAQVASPSLLLFAVTAGFLISIFEFSCTGQIYLPTLVYMINNPDFSMKSSLYLLLYNGMFVFPLLIVFVVVYLFKVNVNRISHLYTNNMHLVKLCISGLFVFFSGYMMYTTVRIFGLVY